MISCISFLLLLFFIWICNFWVESSTQKQIFAKLEKIPFNEVGLVLGTAKYLNSGYQNPYFYHRIEAAAQLYHAGKVKHLLVSGDNSLKSYNEPKAMQAALMEKGVPESAITLDYAGFRTLDSVVRSKAVFGQKNITIISQKFHNQRALFIANQRGVTAVGYNSKDVSFRLGIKIRLREYLARCKAILDIIILNKQPKFLGERVTINI
ncbi:MAG: vancomycin high temperature exclusion protein [Saprospiraceae bacterium]